MKTPQDEAREAIEADPYLLKHATANGSDAGRLDRIIRRQSRMDAVGQYSDGSMYNVSIPTSRDNIMTIARIRRAGFLAESGWIETPESESAGRVARALSVLNALDSAALDEFLRSIPHPPLDFYKSNS